MKALTTNQVAEICGVDRTTVGYWVRTGKLTAQRSGRKYIFNENDLRLFLDAIGQRIPAVLSQQDDQYLDFPTLQSCWEFAEARQNKSQCIECLVSKMRIAPCFAYQKAGQRICAEKCSICEYFKKYYFPRIKFVHQIAMPAAIFKDLCIWVANYAFEKICGFKRGDAIGIGTEHVIHPDSMEMVISYNKKRSLGDPTVPNCYIANIKIAKNRKFTTRLFVTPLAEPRGTFLAILDPI